MTDLRLVLRSLRSRPTSTLVTMLLIAIAVALLLSMRSLREAGRRSFTRGVGNAHLIVSAEAEGIPPWSKGQMLGPDSLPEQTKAKYYGKIMNALIKTLKDDGQTAD